MSHFPVLVLSRPSQSVDDLLIPYIAFQDPEAAKRCASIRDRRAEGAEDPTWHEIDEIEVVLDDRRNG